MEDMICLYRLLILLAALYAVCCSTALILVIPEDCPAGFETIRGSCQPCQPRYFKNSTMIGKPCMACDYMKNDYQEQQCPCTSTQNAIIVCRDDSAGLPETFCKRRSEVQEPCVQPGELQNQPTEITVSTNVTAESRLDARHSRLTVTADVTAESRLDVRHNRSGVWHTEFPITTVHPSREVDIRHAVDGIVIIGSIIIVILIGLIAVICLRTPRWCTKGQNQAHEAAKHPEQAAQLLPAGIGDGSSLAMSRSDEEIEDPLRMHIVNELEDPQSIHGYDVPQHTDRLSRISNMALSVNTLGNDQLDFENSAALCTNPDSNRRSVSLGLFTLQS